MEMSLAEELRLIAVSELKGAAFVKNCALQERKGCYLSCYEMPFRRVSQRIVLIEH